jgi:A/G-specific adenine glycosylase
LFLPIISLDHASSADVAAILHPLGLEWRAGNFKILASELINHYNGKVPSERHELLKLTGVGPYVAEAVRCFASGQPTVIMDTNTVRVAARYFGFAYTPESRRKKQVIQSVSYLISTQQPADSNYALLDFAATICRAQKPDHENCPLASKCAYLKIIQYNKSQPTSTSTTLE